MRCSPKTQVLVISTLNDNIEGESTIKAHRQKFQDNIKTVTHDLILENSFLVRVKKHSFLEEETCVTEIY